ncbi:MAG TPA: hypothetical protein VJN72_15625 [Gaiellales bacterium]|nr:hypothetical protein [Gaiellales bacterium]
MDLVIQIAGAFAVLAAFVLGQTGVLDARSRTYLALNAAGASVLAVDAYAGGQWGFVLLGLIRSAGRKPRPR